MHIMQIKTYRDLTPVEIRPLAIKIVNYLELMT